MRVEEINFDKFCEKIRERCGEDVEKETIKAIYEKNRKRDLYLTLKFAKNMLTSLSTRKGIVLGENRTRYGQHYLIIQEVGSPKLHSLASNNNHECELLDILEFVAKEKNGILYASEIKRVGKAKISDILAFDILDEDNEENAVLLEKGQKFVLLAKTINPKVFAGIDWDKYEELEKRSHTRTPLQNQFLRETTLTSHWGSQWKTGH